jgi:hypothetical protein
MNKHTQYLVLWCVSLLILFVVMPFLLLFFGFNCIVTLSFVVGIVALLADGILTKIALDQNCSETNPLFTILNEKISENVLIMSSRLFGIIMLSIILLVLNGCCLQVTSSVRVSDFFRS